MKNKQAKKVKEKKKVYEVYLSEVISVFIIIGILLAIITTVKIVKTIQDTKNSDLLASEENIDEYQGSVSAQSELEDASYISIASNIVSLQENGKTKLNIVNLFNGEEITYDNLTIEWVIESNDGGNVEVKREKNDLYVYGKSVGNVKLKARVTYNGTTNESNTVELTVKKELDPYYQKVTLFRYDPKTLFELGGSVTDTEKQGIYFVKNSQIPSVPSFQLSDWNYWHSSTPKNAYTGLVENELDANGNIVFTKPDYGIFDESNTNGKQVYTNVGIPLKSLGNGYYQMKSSEMEVHFENGVAQSDVNLVYSDTKNSYNDGWGSYFSGFFPFNSVNREEAIYHFGMHAKVPFYMTEDGKTNIGETEDIMFEFSGDDDVWIFIDGKLVIDLGGIHDEISADINFATGEITTYLGLKSTNQIAKRENILDVLGSDWNSNIEEQHSLEVFYLERGAGGSNCTINFNMPQEVQKSEVIVHHYIDGTTQKIAEDEVIEGKDGDLYRTSPTSNIPPMYELAEEKLPENAIGIIEEAKVKEVIYYYRLKEESNIEKTGTTQISTLTQNVDYKISYNAAIKYYEGKSVIKIVDKLPLKIDESTSSLDNGIYDQETQTITWSGTYDQSSGVVTWDNSNAASNEDVVNLEDGNIQITKDLSLTYKDIPLDETKIVNKVEGIVESEEGLQEIVENTFETTTDFKTKVVVEKNWMGDTETQRPTEVTVKLMADGNEQQTAILNSQNAWTTTFENLDNYNDKREEIEYSIEEDVPEGYFLSSNDKTEIEGGEKYTLTNFKYGELILTKVAQEDNAVKLSGTEFKLCRLVGDSSAGSELIDPDNVTSDWELVDSCTTKEDGLIKFSNLVKTSEYRLIETKAPYGRMMPEGQWKIEFIYGEYDQNDETIKNVNGTLVRISAIGNPPALIETKEGNLLLPNQLYYDFPVSGGLGKNGIFMIGGCTILLGIVIFNLRKPRYKAKRYK